MSRLIVSPDTYTPEAVRLLTDIIPHALKENKLVCIEESIPSHYMDALRLMIHLEQADPWITDRTIWSIGCGLGIVDLYATLAGMQVYGHDRSGELVDIARKLSQNAFSSSSLPVKTPIYIRAEHRLNDFPGKRPVSSFARKGADVLGADYWYIFPYPTEANMIVDGYLEHASPHTTLILNTGAVSDVGAAAQAALGRHKDSLVYCRDPFPFIEHHPFYIVNKKK
ncbi:MAG: hypothetical protein ABIJ34_04655 [archaeon]